jgi:competence ComEA-like helix-hairpin-helix protein
LTGAGGCARIQDVSDDLAKARDQLVVGLIAGAGVGAAVGLIALGEFVFLPVVTMIAGAMAGLAIAARQAGVRAGLSQLLEVVFEGESRTTREARVRRARPAASRDSASPRRPAPRRVRVPPPVGPPPPLPAGRAPIDLNTAGIEELEALPGVVRAGAARIVAYRDVHGPFASLDDLERVWGFDEARVAHLSLWATLSDGESDPRVATVAAAEAPAAGPAPAG